MGDKKILYELTIKSKAIGKLVSFQTHKKLNLLQKFFIKITLYTNKSLFSEKKL